MPVFRTIRRNWTWFLINVAGLGTALAVVLIVFLFTVRELSYDRFHSKADRIYRITVDSNRGATSMHPARVAGNLPEELKKQYPAIEEMVRLVPYRKAVIRIGEQKFFTVRAFSTDSSFFRVFDFKVLTGNPAQAFSQPGRTFICRSLAMKYFGSIDVVGKEISILHQQQSTPKMFTITGVMEDFPANSHFHADLLTSFSDEESGTDWAYTYYLLKKGVDAKTLVKTIRTTLDKENKTNEPVPLVYLQKLTDIHLYSHKSREMEKNGSSGTIFLLGFGTLIILFIALVNFLNLSKVQFITRFKSLKIKMINGASRQVIAREIVAESVILSLVAVISGFMVAGYLGGSLGISLMQSGRIPDLVLIALILMVVVGLLSVIPLYTAKMVSGLKIAAGRGRLYTFPLIAQFALAVVTITGTLVLNRQMDFIGSEHPESQNEDILVITNNPSEIVQRYEVFRTELLKNPAVTGVTSVMENPGGDILDNFEFEMEGIEKKPGRTLNILTADVGFFSMLGITPLAGTIDPGNTPSLQWEADALALNALRSMPKPDPRALEVYQKKVGDYREKYILNRSALNLLGIVNPQDAIGRRFRLNFFMDELFPEGEVVGVVPDFHYTNLHNEEKPLVMVPRKMFNNCIIIGTNPALRGTAVKAIGAVWKKVNPDYPFQVESLASAYRGIYADEYAQARVISMFALISVILSMLGMFALAAFTMQRRVKEIGIRKINGAAVWEVMVMLNGEFLKWVALGYVIAIPVAWYAMHRWLESFAYKAALSWWIFAVSGLISIGTALLTVSWLSWRAAARNPMESLRYE